MVRGAVLKHGHEGVRQIEAQITNTWAGRPPPGAVEPWVYQRISETFVLDERCGQGWRSSTRRPARAWRTACWKRDRNYWQPDEDTLEALQDAADEIEDRMEGIAAE
jgi:magnesium chelatase subunit H